MNHNKPTPYQDVPSFLKPVDLSVEFISLKNSPPIALDESKKPSSSLSVECNPFEQSFGYDISRASSGASSLTNKQASIANFNESTSGSLDLNTAGSGSSNTGQNFENSSSAPLGISYEMVSKAAEVYPSDKNSSLKRNIFTHQSSEAPSNEGSYEVQSQFMAQLLHNWNSNNNNLPGKLSFNSNQIASSNTSGSPGLDSNNTTDAGNRLSLQARNRLAAQKCREKKRTQLKQLEIIMNKNLKSIQVMEAQEMKLREEISKLQKLLASCQNCPLSRLVNSQPSLN